MANPILAAANVSSGPYQAYYKAHGASSFVTLGSTRAEEGVKERITKGGKTITESALGEGTVVDFVYNGQERFLDLVLQDFRRDSVQLLLNDHNAIFPGGVTANQRQFHMGQPGALASQFAGELKLAQWHPNLPHRAPSASTILHYWCVAVAEESTIELAMKADLIYLPISLRLLPGIVPGSESSQNPLYAFGEFVNSI